ncbi:MAG: hypothetical protein WDW36_006243 [Sanguina aurantia]
MLSFCQQLPKIELHAHLNGSVRLQSIRQLVAERGITDVTEQELASLDLAGRPRCLLDAFKLFDIIHRVTTTHESVTWITTQVLHDFHQDGVVYCELRTTPKARPGMTKASYVEAVLTGIRLFTESFAQAGSAPHSARPPQQESTPAAPGRDPSPPLDRMQAGHAPNPLLGQQQQRTAGRDADSLEAQDGSSCAARGRPSADGGGACISSTGRNLAGRSVADQAAQPVWVRLLLSIDRREGPAAAMETVQLAGKLHAMGAAEGGGLVVGIDLSGNPALGCWEDWEPALQHARSLGLKISLHAAEVYSPAETAAMLGFAPDRLGHMCCLDPDLEAALWASGIPVELCLTSNLLTSSVPTYTDHHFGTFHAHTRRHPLVLCTDDSGVFGTTLSQEYAIAAQAFGLTEADILQLALSAVDYTFLQEAEKQELRAAFSSKGL